MAIFFNSIGPKGWGNKAQMHCKKKNAFCLRFYSRPTFSYDKIMILPATNSTQKGQRWDDRDKDVHDAQFGCTRATIKRRQKCDENTHNLLK